MEAKSCARCGLGLWPGTALCPRCALPQADASGTHLREGSLLLAPAPPSTRQYGRFRAITPVTRQHVRNRGVLLIVIGFTFVLLAAIASWVSSALHSDAASTYPLWIGGVATGGACIFRGVRRLLQL